METIAMFGPSISDPTQTVNRKVPKADVQAYKAAGYKEGTIAEPPCYTLEDAIAQNDGVDVTKVATRGTKRK